MQASRFTKLLVKGCPSSEKPIEVTDASGNVLFDVAAGGYGALRYTEVAITNAEIKALRATPKTLVTAPGAGKVAVLLSGVLLHDYGSNALTESTDNMAVRYTNGSGVIASQAIEATGFADATADTMTTIQAKIDAIVAKTGCENQALVLHNTGDGEYGGNAGADTVWRAKILYVVYQTGW